MTLATFKSESTWNQSSTKPKITSVYSKYTHYQKIDKYKKIWKVIFNFQKKHTWHKYKSKQLRKMKNVAIIDWLAHIFLYMKLNDITIDQFHASVDQQHYTLPVSDGIRVTGLIFFFKLNINLKEKILNWVYRWKWI